MQKIVLKSTHKGFVSRYVWSAFLLCAIWFFLSWVLNYQHTVSSETVSVSFGGETSGGVPWFFGEKYVQWTIILFHVFVYLVYGVLCGLVLWSLYTAVYHAGRVTTFVKLGECGMGKILDKTYSPLFGKRVGRAVFHEIKDFHVQQSAIDRLPHINTGTIYVTACFFHPAGMKEHKWKIPAIANPHEAVEQLDDMFITTQSNSHQLAFPFQREKE